MVSKQTYAFTTNKPKEEGHLRSFDDNSTYLDDEGRGPRDETRRIPFVAPVAAPSDDSVFVSRGVVSRDFDRSRGDVSAVLILFLTSSPRYGQ